MSTPFLPTPLLALTSLSLLNTITSFILAFFNYGLLTVWVSGGSALVTLLYHIIVLYLAYRRWYQHKAIGGKDPLQYYAFGSLVWAYVLLALWVVTFGLVLQVTIGGMMSLQPSETSNNWNLGIQLAESILGGLEMLTLGAIAIHCTRGNKREAYEALLLADERRRWQSHTPLEEKPPANFMTFTEVNDKLAPPPTAHVKTVSFV